MSAAYDTYDYPSYWVGREYEHEAELTAISSFLDGIAKIHSIVEIGSGYARLTPSYIFRASKITLVDPSKKLLQIAMKNLPNKKITFIQAKIENLPQKMRKNSADLIIMVRVLHHIKNLDLVFGIINNILKPNGYFILEFANKTHLKATLTQFLRGNFTFPYDIFTKDLRSKKNIKGKTIPFLNYHPDLIKEKLLQHGFSIVETRSVSNIRNPILKKLLPIEILLYIEKKLQKPLAKIFFGPSIFIFARKNL